MKKFLLIVFTLVLTTVLFFSCKEDSSTEPEKSDPTSDYQIIDGDEGTIGAAGGIITVPTENGNLSGAFVEIPQGALTQNENIKISQAAPSEKNPEDSSAIVVKFEPSGIKFTKPITVGLPLKQYNTGDKVYAYYYDKSQNLVEQIFVTSVDGANKVVSAEVEHFSSYYSTVTASGYQLSTATMGMQLLNIDGKIGARIFDLGRGTYSGLQYIYSNSSYTNALQGLMAGYYTRAHIIFYLYDKGNIWDSNLETHYFQVRRIQDAGAKWVITIEDENYNELLRREIFEDQDDLNTWFSGIPILCKFKNTNPSSSKNYYVKIHWHISDYDDPNQFLGASTQFYNFTSEDQTATLSQMYSYSNDTDGNYIDDDFETSGGTPPAKPILISPQKNALNVSTSPVFIWNASNGATSYALMVDDDNFSGSNYFYNEIVGNVTSKQVTGLKVNTVYKWRVFASNAFGSELSDSWTFTTSGGGAPPTVTTSSISNITANSASGGGNVTSDGGASVTARGVCWSTSQNPTVSNSKTTSGTGTGSFTSAIIGLSQNTTYYVRAYATNSAGTSYGSQVSFTTSSGGGTLPTVTTSSISNITANTATGGGNVTSDGGASVTARGVCWSTSQNPTISDSKTTNGTGTGSFISSIIGLSPNTTYYVRAYATNSAGTSYGSQVSFTTSSGGGGSPCPGIATVSYAGKTYNTVQIGGQCWLKENLDVGTRIDGANDMSDNGTIEKYCYDNDPANCSTYGGLYQWPEAMQYTTVEGAKGICPNGWHIPTRADFEELDAFVGDAAAKLVREDQPATGYTPTNETGFSALFTGLRYHTGNFLNLGTFAYFYSSAEYNSSSAYYMYLNFYLSEVRLHYDHGKVNGFSVRCVQD